MPRLKPLYDLLEPEIIKEVSESADKYVRALGVAYSKANHSIYLLLGNLETIKIPGDFFTPCAGVYPNFPQRRIGYGGYSIHLGKYEASVSSIIHHMNQD